MVATMSKDGNAIPAAAVEALNQNKEEVVNEKSSSSTDNKYNTVHLGYCVPIQEDDYCYIGHSSPNWSSWDGGKVGGKPSWLIPQYMPKRSQLQCCSNKDMIFLVQLYCPMDEFQQQHQHAFHRTMYVFVCPNHATHNTNCGGVKVFRCQLHRQNPYYPLECLHEEEEGYKTWKKHQPHEWNVQTCRVCGVFATGKCPVQNYFFCGKNHQKEHLKNVHNKTKVTTSTSFSSIFPQHELVVEDEPTTTTNNEDQMKMFHSIKDKSLFSNDIDVHDDGVNSNDINLEQIDLNKMIGGEGPVGGGVTDLRTIEFYTRITRGGKATSSQCLRYSRWPEEEEDDDDDCDDDGCGVPLWISSECIPKSKKEIPACTYCGSIRKPEFQIMPQMLNYVHANKQQQTQTMSNEARDATIAAASIAVRDNTVDDDTKHQMEQKLQELKQIALQGAKDELNFGSIVVYTCEKSCNGATTTAAYMEEFAWRQPPLDEY